MSLVNPTLSQVPQLVFDYRSPYDYKFVQLSDTDNNGNTVGGIDRIRIGQRTRTAFNYLEELVVVPIYDSTGTYSVRVEVDGEAPERVEWSIDGALFRDDDLNSPFNVRYAGRLLPLGHFFQLRNSHRTFFNNF